LPSPINCVFSLKKRAHFWYNYVMKLFLVFVLLPACVFSFSSCKKSRTEDRIIASINGERVPESEFTLFQKICRLKPGPGASERMAKTARLNKFIERKIVLAEAKRQKLYATPAERATAAKDLLDDPSGGFAEALKRQGLGLEDWRNYSAEQVLFEKAVSVFAGEVTAGEDEIKTYYGSHLKEFSRGEQAHVYQIVSDNAGAAENIRKELERGADFEAIAKSRSVSPDRENGGDLGFVSPEDLPAEMSLAVFKTEPGKLSPVTKSDYGFHVFLVKEQKKRGAAKLDEVKLLIGERIRRAKSEKALAAKLKELGGATEVKINKAYLEELK